MEARDGNFWRPKLYTKHNPNKYKVFTQRCYFSDQPTIYGELVRAKSIEEDVDNNTISVEASEGFSVQNVSKVGNQPKSVLSFLCLV